jgi:hypothetical protein
VRATGSVEALVGYQEALDGLAVHDVRVDDLFHIVRRNASIPNTIGINDYCRAVLALIEASRHVGAHSFLESAQRQLLFEEKLQLGLALGIAAPARMSRISLVAADEQMLFELGHEFNVQDSGALYWFGDGLPAGVAAPNVASARPLHQHK